MNAYNSQHSGMSSNTQTINRRAEYVTMTWSNWIWYRAKRFLSPFITNDKMSFHIFECYWSKIKPIMTIQKQNGRVANKSYIQFRSRMLLKALWRNIFARECTFFPLINYQKLSLSLHSSFYIVFGYTCLEHTIR